MEFSSREASLSSRVERGRSSIYALAVGFHWGSTFQSWQFKQQNSCSFPHSLGVGCTDCAETAKLRSRVWLRVSRHFSLPVQPLGSMIVICVTAFCESGHGIIARFVGLCLCEG